MQASSVAQLVRATGCGEEGHEFESRTSESFFSLFYYLFVKRDALAPV